MEKSKICVIKFYDRPKLLVLNRVADPNTKEHSGEGG